MAEHDRMSMEGEKVAHLQSIRRSDHEDSPMVQRDLVASASPRRSLLKKKSNMSVRSLQHATSPTVPTPSTVNLSPCTSHDRPASCQSQDARSSSSSIPPSLERAESLAKRLRVRGSKLFKRQHSRTNPSSLRGLYWVTDSQVGMNRSLDEWASLHRGLQHNRTHSTGSQ